MSMLFDLDDFEETRVEWVVLSGQMERCGLCGARCSYNQGGTDTGPVCDACAVIDRCCIREHNPVAERRPERPFTTDGVAHCENCTWVLLARNWGEDREWTGDEILDAMAEHARPVHTSRWGVTHEIADHDRLVAEQAKRRATYLAKVATA